MLCHNADFFAYIEKNYGPQLPVFRGSGGYVLGRRGGLVGRGDGAGRQAHETVGAAERFFALTGPLWPDKVRPGGHVPRHLAQLHPLRRAHLGRALLDHPTRERVHQGPMEDQGPVRPGCRPPGRRRAGRGRADRGRRGADAGRAVIVLNPTSWQRTDLLRIRLPRGTSIDPARGRLLRRRRHHAGPGQGRACLRLPRACAGRARPRRPAAAPTPATTIESRFYRLRFDRIQRGDRQYRGQGDRPRAGRCLGRLWREPIPLRRQRQAADPQCAGRKAAGDRHAATGDPAVREARRSG